MYMCVYFVDEWIPTNVYNQTYTYYRHTLKCHKHSKKYINYTNQKIFVFKRRNKRKVLNEGFGDYLKKTIIQMKVEQSLWTLNSFLIPVNEIFEIWLWKSKIPYIDIECTRHMIEPILVDKPSKYWKWDFSVFGSDLFAWLMSVYCFVLIMKIGNFLFERQ